MPLFDASLISNWTGGCWLSEKPVTINGISIDSRTLKSGDLFVAIKGARFDGHNFLKQACKNGASGVVVDTLPTEKKLSTPLLFVKNTSEALLSMGSSHRKVVGAHIIAITGSVGKTTVKEMTADVLARGEPVARTRGNWNNELGLPLSLLMMERTTKTGVFEVGMNHPGELKKLCETLSPNWGIITNIGTAHFEFFNSIKDIAMEKSELLKSLPENGTAFLRNDQEWYELLKSRTKCKIVTISVSGEADYSCLLQTNGTIRVSEKSTGEIFICKPPLPGRHMMENALFAIAVGRCHGISWENIGEAIEAFKPQSMRWEREQIDSVDFINDAYNANPMSMSAALQTFSGVEASGKKWLVLGGMFELGEVEEKAHLKIGSEAAGGPWEGLITIGKLGSLIAEGAERAGMSRARIYKCINHADIAAMLRKLTAPGDIVLLKASRGERMENILKEWKNTNKNF